MNIQKSNTFLYTSNEYVEFEIKNTISYISIPKMKYLSIYLTKYVQDLYGEKILNSDKLNQRMNKWRFTHARR